MIHLLDELRIALGPAAVIDPAEMPEVLVGYRGVHSGEAMAVVRPGCTEEVSAVMRLCNERGASVVTQGGNTGLAGGSVPVEDPTHPTVVLLLSRLNRIESISPGGSCITVEAGVTLGAVQEAAAQAGLMFAPDWGARGTATIGGAISTNAGGVNVLAWGPMRNHVLGLEVVLADGRVWNGLRALRKDSSGYDLKHLFIGAEGTLGVITKATLSLLPSINYQSTAFAAIGSTSDLTEVMKLARAATGGTLTALELIPEFGVAAICDKTGRSRPLATRAKWYLLIRFGSNSPVEEDLARFLAKAADRDLIVDAAVAATQTQNDDLWLFRDELSPPGLIPNHELAVKYDSVVPIDRISDYITAIEQTCQSIAPGTLPYIFGHIGDGNLHIHLFASNTEPDRSTFFEHKPRMYDAIDQLTWSMGGSISAEHGIGQELRDRIVGQKPAIEFDLMRDLKELLDPSHTLNPGKTIPPAPAR